MPLVFTSCECHLFRSQKSHWLISNLLITQIPSNNCRIKEWLSPPFQIILSDMAVMCNLESLIIINRRSTPHHCSLKESPSLPVAVPPPVAVPQKKAVATRVSSQPLSNLRKFSLVNKSRGLKENVASPQHLSDA